MRYRRAISVLTLAAFLPLATGCTNRQTIEIDTDPSRVSDERSLEDPLEVEGYTLRDGQHFEWPGYVVLVGADSVLFTPKQPQSEVKPGIFNPRPRAVDPTAESFALDLHSLRSLDVIEPDPVGTALLVTGTVAAFSVLVVGLALATWDGL